MLLTSGQIFWLLLVATGGASITVWTIIEHLGVRVKARAKVEQAQAREETRREIAAYVAEGSISPEDGARLMGVGSEGLEGVRADLREMLAKGVETVRVKVRESAREGCRQSA